MIQSNLNIQTYQGLLSITSFYDAIVGLKLPVSGEDNLC